MSLILQWRHNECNDISNHRHLDYLLKRFFRCRSKKKPKLCVTGLCEGNSPVTGEFPTHRASNLENVSIWWCHHESCWNLADWLLVAGHQQASYWYQNIRDLSYCFHKGINKLCLYICRNKQLWITSYRKRFYEYRNVCMVSQSSWIRCHFPWAFTNYLYKVLAFGALSHHIY